MQKSVYLGGLGAVLVLIAAIFGFVVVPNIFENKIKDELKLVRGTTAWNKWIDIESGVYLNFYIFNITNPEEVDSGGAPNLQQVGPYVYRQRRQKLDPNSDTCKETVKYEQRITYFFDQKKSGERRENDTVNIINVPFISVISSVPPQAAPIVAQLLPSEKIVRKGVDAGEVIFHGFDVSDYNQSLISPALPEEFSGFRFGLYKGKNLSTDGQYEVYTGTKGSDYFGIIKAWKGNTSLSYWGGEKCNELSGTDGSVFPPFIKKDESIKIFNSDLCRTLELTFKEEVDIQNIKGYRFTLPKEALEGAVNNEDNACFCTRDDKEECQDGIIDVSICRSGPIVLSKPHFLDGYDKFISYSGLSPDRELHETTIDVEPKTGILLAANKRIQINIEVRKIENVPQLANITEAVIFPAAWINEEATICDVDAKDFKSRVDQPMKSVNIAKWTVIGIGILCILVAVVIPIAFKKKSDVV